jgi:poly(A) polymerase
MGLGAGYSKAALDALSSIAKDASEAYLVGGAVRDYVLGLTSADLDLVVNLDGYEIASRVADRFAGKLAFVPLDPAHGTGRIVVKATGETIDVSRFKAFPILEDLIRRDFTINALLIPLPEFLESESPTVIDLLGGLRDIADRKIRACSDLSIIEDPLRILRGFRFAVQLGFELDRSTADTMAATVGLLVDVAPERVRDELFATLSSNRSFPVIKRMDEAGIFDALFPELIPMKGCSQNTFHHLDVWEHSLESIHIIEETLKDAQTKFGEFYRPVLDYLREEIVTGRTKIALIKLAALYHDSGKPEAKFVDDQGRIRFFGHEKISAELSENAGEKLKLSKRETRLLVALVKAHMQATVFTSRSLSDRSIRRLFRKFQGDLAGLLILFLGDLGATRGPAKRPDQDENATVNVKRTLEMICDLEESRFEPLVSGEDLIRFFKIEPGPSLGKLLKKLTAMQDAGRITNTQQALIAADALLRKQGWE